MEEIVMLKVEKLMIKYSYLNIPRETILQMAREELIQLKDKYNSPKILSNVIQHKLEAKIINLGTKLFNDSVDINAIINKYINDRYSDVSSYEEAVVIIKDLNQLFLKYRCVPDPNILGKLIMENAIINESIDIITSKYLKAINEGKLELLFNDNIIVTLLGIYCMINDIQVGEYVENTEANKAMSTDNAAAYYNEIKNIPMISFKELEDLYRRIDNGDETAKKRVIEGNLKLVVSVAKHFYQIDSSMKMLDLIQAGNIGLIKGVDKYNINLGYRFSTYATWWIRTEIVREIQNTGKTIRIPIYLHERINAYKKVKEKLEQTKGTKVTPDEVAKTMKIPVAMAYECEKHGENLLSLNYLISAAEDFEMLDAITDDSINRQMELCYLSSEVKALLNNAHLTNKEMEVLVYRYGLNDGIPRTLEEVGIILGSGKEDIRRKEAKALYKIRTAAQTKNFADYMDDPEMALEMLDRFKEAYLEYKYNMYKLNPLEDKDKGYNTVKCK